MSLGWVSGYTVLTGVDPGLCDVETLRPVSRAPD